MYEPYPATGPAQGPDRIPQPRTVRNAMRLMYLGAALEIPVVIIAVVARGTFQQAILRPHPDYTAAQLRAAELGRALDLVVIGAIVAALWLWMAWANGRGRAWARIVSAVFFGLGTVEVVLAFARSDNVAALAIDVIVWLVGLGAIVLLFSKESVPFYRPS